MILTQISIIPLIQFSITLIFLGYASFTDLKERIVRNSITFSLVFLGLIFHLILSFYFNDFNFIFNSISAGILAFLFSFILYKTGVWAGGDVKLFTGIAVLNPFNPSALSFLVPFLSMKMFSLPLFFLLLFILSILSVFPYAIILSFSLLNKNKDKKIKVINSFKELIFSIALFSFFLSATKNLLFFLEPIMLSVIMLVIVLIYSFVLKEKRIYSIPLFFLSFILISPKQLLTDFSLSFFSLTVIASLFFFYNQTKTLLIERKKISELKEGDIPAETIIEINSKIIRKETLSLKKIIKYLKELNVNRLMLEIKPKGKIIVSAANARGLNETELKELKKLAGEKLINEIKVKKSMAMVPAILIAYIIANIIGDILWFLI